MALPLHRFRPRLLDALKHYDGTQLARDVGAGLTVGIVALPLAMAFAIASGVKPEAGLFTAIIAGFLISALGGSQVQIGGPAGAFIVIVYGIVERYGLANLLIATSLAGLLLFAMGLLRLGALVRYIPVSIVIGFTNGIAVLIGLSQLKDLLGLKIDKMPADFFSQIGMLVQHLDSFNPAAFGIGLACLAIVVLWPKSYTMPEHPLGWRPHVRRWAYFHILPDRALTMQLFASHTGSLPARLSAARPLLLLAALAFTLPALGGYAALRERPALAEEVPGGFASAYRILAAAEEAGRVRRGYFVEGLGAAPTLRPTPERIVRHESVMWHCWHWRP